MSPLAPRRRADHTGVGLVDLLRRAGLTGRGGAGFDTATKIAAAQTSGARLVVNACDGEIGSAKDAWIVRHALDDLVAGARLVSPSRPAVYAAHRGSATADLLHARGHEVLGVPARYVSSEESSLVSLLHGGTARPMTKRAPFVHGGRDGDGRRIRPTLVLNAETLWRIAQIAEHGPAWFRGIGTDAEPGPRLVTVCGHVSAPRVVETAAGEPIEAILDAAGGADPEAEFVLVGGLSGAILAVRDAVSLTWSAADLTPHRASSGAGVVEVLDPARCPLDVVADLLATGAGESARQCGPCMVGLPALHDAWRDLLARPTPAALAAIETRIGLLPGRGACRHPDGIARLAASALTVLRPHLHAHAEGRCPTRSPHDRLERHAS